MKLLKVGLVVSATNQSGYEVIIKVLSEPEILEICTPIIFGLQSKINQALANVHPEQQMAFSTIKNINEAIDGKINVVDGFETESNALACAITSHLHNLLDVIIDIPTEICNIKDKHDLSDFFIKALEAEQKDVFDWTINGNTHALVLHPLSISTKLDEAEATEAFISDITTISKSLRKDYTLIKPRIAILSKNEKIHKDIVDLREHGVFAFGPFDAEAFVSDEKYRQYDAVLFLEEDSEFKKMNESIGQDTTFGYISGLPVVVTYLLNNGAEPSVQAFKEALFSSLDIHRNRIRYRRASSNPLEKQWIPRGRDDFKLDLSKEDSE